jgi:hypothetical protein
MLKYPICIGFLQLYNKNILLTQKEPNYIVSDDWINNNNIYNILVIVSNVPSTFINPKFQAKCLACYFNNKQNICKNNWKITYLYNKV